jgi:hypothetical protein
VLYISSVERGDYSTGLDQRRLQLHLDADGIVTQVSSRCPWLHMVAL